MSNPITHDIEYAVQIAWDYLERTGEIEREADVSLFLVNTVDTMIRQGECRRLMLANRAIDAYRRHKVAA